MLIGKACTISRTHLARSPRNWCPQLTSKYLQTLNCHNSYEGRITAINYLNWQCMSNWNCLEHIKPAWGCIDCTMGDMNSFGDRSNLAPIPFKWVIKLVLSHARRLGGNTPIDSYSHDIPNCLCCIERTQRSRLTDFTWNKTRVMIHGQFCRLWSGILASYDHLNDSNYKHVSYVVPTPAASIFCFIYFFKLIIQKNPLLPWQCCKT